FEDVVASLNPLAEEQSDVPAHWSVTFAVDDADATAAKAAELGGRVVVAPFDAPWVRMTVLSDPHGATFIASKFVPENKDLANRPVWAGGGAEGTSTARGPPTGSPPPRPLAQAGRAVGARLASRCRPRACAWRRRSASLRRAARPRGHGPGPLLHGRQARDY